MKPLKHASLSPQKAIIGRANLGVLILTALLTFLPFNTTIANAQSTQYARENKVIQEKGLKDRIYRYHEVRRKSPQGREPLVHSNGRYLGNNPQLRAQMDIEESYGRDVSKEIGYWLEVEPTIRQIQFFKSEEPRTLDQRIDNLLYGVTVMLPPKYDLYGYEIRRYMSSIAGPEVFSDPHRLAKEVANAERAQIIFEHWSKEIRDEIKDIEAVLEADKTITPTTRSNFKFKSGKAKAFMIEAGSWVSNNKRMLEMLFDARNRYEYIDPRINFAREEEAKKFLNLFRARQKSLEIMHEYPPFRMMIY